MDALEVGAYWLLLLTAWEQERHGYLPDDDDKLRRWSKLTREQWAQSRELILSRFPVSEEGWRANPRMVAEAEKAMAFAKKQSENGKRGGRPEKNPSSSFNKPSLSKNKPSLQKSKAKKSLPLPLPLSSKEDLRRRMCEPFVSTWNAERDTLPEVLKLTDSRVHKLHLRMTEGFTLEQMTKAITISLATPFLRGEGERGWKLNFDFLIENDTHVSQVLEGKFGKQDCGSSANPKPFIEPDALYNSPAYQGKVVNQ